MKMRSRAINKIYNKMKRKGKNLRFLQMRVIRGINKIYLNELEVGLALITIRNNKLYKKFMNYREFRYDNWDFMSYLKYCISLIKYLHSFGLEIDENTIHYNTLLEFINLCNSENEKREIEKYLDNFWKDKGNRE